jgi:hypothetical protein
MDPHFLIGAVVGSFIAIFGGREPVRRLVESWQSNRDRRRND